MATDKIASFATTVKVMKPNKIDKNKKTEIKKLEALIDSDDFVMEEKIDGCHYKMIGNRFFSIDDVEKTSNFPHLVEFISSLNMVNLILDGEIHYPGKTSQYATHVTGSTPEVATNFQNTNGYIHYTIFELLRTPKAHWTIENTYRERRRLLEHFYNTFIKGKPIEEYIHIVPARFENKKAYVESLLAEGKEGGVLKKLDGKYLMGKKPKWNWMKVKQEDTTDLIIIGFEKPKREYTGKNTKDWLYWEELPDGSQIPVTEWYARGWIGSIILGAYVKGSLQRICTASGIAKAVREDMTNNPNKYLNKIARVKFMEKTTDGYPRHPYFVNMHEGKRLEECVWDFN